MIFDLGPYLTAFGGALTALVAGLLTIWANRKKSSADVQAVINAGFKQLVDEQRDDINVLRAGAKEDEAEITRQRLELKACTQRLEELLRFIRAQGLSPPPPE